MPGPAATAPPDPSALPLAARLVAHRGCPATHPENSLAGIGAALVAGARWLEVDVQLTRDGCPVLLHDQTLERVAGDSRSVTRLRLDDLARLDFGERARLGRRGPRTPPATLADAIDVLQDGPATLFVEVKPESVRAFGVDRTLACLEPVAVQARFPLAFISFHLPLITKLCARGDRAAGWILNDYADDALETASRLDLEWIFCSRTRVPSTVARLPAGLGAWVVYVVDDASGVSSWLGRGAALVETDCFPALVADLGER